MGSITHQGPSRVAAYATAAAITMKLAGPLFATAMTANAVNDPQDKTYKAWYLMRQVADRFMDNWSLILPSAILEDYKDALKVAHVNAHPHAANPHDLGDCECETAMRVKWILQLLAGAPSSKPVRKVRDAEPIFAVHSTGAQCG